MDSKQYTIGEFASMNKVSSRMLRHYDKIGLLCPASILPNGYRSYGKEQIEVISQIKRLRDCGFLLEEIDGILQNDNPQFLLNAVKHKTLELQGQAAQQQNTMQSLRKLAQEPALASPSLIYGVSLTAHVETKLLTQIQPISWDSVEGAFDVLYRLLGRKKLRAVGCAALLSHFDCTEEDQTQVSVPISTDYHDECYEMLVLPAASALSVVHYGDYYTIGHAYGALLQYAGQNDLPIADLFVERYFLDSSHGVSPAEYVTEISVTIKNTP